MKKDLKNTLQKLYFKKLLKDSIQNELYFHPCTFENTIIIYNIT